MNEREKRLEQCMKTYTYFVQVYNTNSAQEISEYVTPAALLAEVDKLVNDDVKFAVFQAECLMDQS